jgi:MFS family permease
MVPGLAALLLAAACIGTGTGIITPVAFASLAATGDPGRLGQTMGTAELGRELGDAGGPLLVGAIATAVSLTAGYGALALLLISVPATAAHRSGRKASPTGPDNQVPK